MINWPKLLQNCAMRNAFIEELVILARKHPQIALVVGDLGFSVVEAFADEFPDRFINAGIAEQNMTGLAAGMASEGYHVFTYSIANFPTFRCAEQIRNDVDFHNLPVTVVSVGGGLAYGALGYSHHAVQDYALMRTFPNMLIASPGDPMEARACTRYLVENPSPSYLRLGKAGEPCFHENVPTIHPGHWLEVSRGSEKQTFLTTGATLRYAIERQLASGPNRPSVHSMPLWGMKCKGLQVKQADRFEEVVTLEDHLFDGGFGSWLLEAISQSRGASDRIRNEALHYRVCGTVGTQEILNQYGGISPNYLQQLLPSRPNI
jgi:transketolase